MIKTKSQALSFAEDLTSLKEQFVSPVIVGKLEALERNYPVWRRCRGDGNCYYRAFGFAYIEKLLLLDDRERLKSLFKRLEATTKLSECVFLLREATKSLPAFYEAMLGDAKRDAALIWCIRLLIAEFITLHAQDDFNGIPLNVAADACGFSSIEDFIQNDVLKWGAEAESLIQTVSPFVFDHPITIRMVQIDSKEENAEYALRNDNTSSNGDEMSVCLLFKPGHYDILYSAEEGAEIQKVEREPDVQECREVVICTVCMGDEALPDRPGCGCSVGFCADCRDAYAQQHTMMDSLMSRVVPCPSCNSPWELVI